MNINALLGVGVLAAAFYSFKFIKSYLNPVNEVLQGAADVVRLGQNAAGSAIGRTISDGRGEVIKSDDSRFSHIRTFSQRDFDNENFINFIKKNSLKKLEEQHINSIRTSAGSKDRPLFLRVNHIAAVSGLDATLVLKAMKTFLQDENIRR